jgi:hypothetical protein
LMASDSLGERKPARSRQQAKLMRLDRGAA